MANIKFNPSFFYWWRISFLCSKRRVYIFFNFQFQNQIVAWHYSVLRDCLLGSANLLIFQSWKKKIPGTQIKNKFSQEPCFETWITEFRSRDLREEQIMDDSSNESSRFSRWPPWAINSTEIIIEFFYYQGADPLLFPKKL